MTKTKLCGLLPSLSLFSFLFFVKPRPLQRCVSMLQTESLRKQRFQTLSLAYEKFGESASLYGSSICAFGRSRWVASSAGDGLARSRVCNWHQKSRAWGCLALRRGCQFPWFLWESRYEACEQHLECNTQRVAFPLLGVRPHNSIPIILLRTRLHQLFFPQVRSGFRSPLGTRILLTICSLRYSTDHAARTQLDDISLTIETVAFLQLPCFNSLVVTRIVLSLI